METKELTKSSEGLSKETHMYADKSVEHIQVEYEVDMINLQNAVTKFYNNQKQFICGLTIFKWAYWQIIPQKKSEIDLKGDIEDKFMKDSKELESAFDIFSHKYHQYLNGFTFLYERFNISPVTDMKLFFPKIT